MTSCSDSQELYEAHHLLVWAYDLLVQYRDILETSFNYEFDEECEQDWQAFEDEYNKLVASCGMEDDNVEDQE